MSASRRETVGTAANSPQRETTLRQGCWRSSQGMTGDNLPSVGRKIEHQHFGAAAVLQRQGAAVGLERIACAERLSVHAQLAARDVDVALAPWSELEPRLLLAVEEARRD